MGWVAVTSMRSHGPPTCKAQVEAAQTRGFHTLGLKLVDLVTSHEFSILNASWDVIENGRRTQAELDYTVLRCCNVI
jgi:hypothetical protein